jgi:hypothetical protein
MGQCADYEMDCQDCRDCLFSVLPLNRSSEKLVFFFRFKKSNG